MDLNLIWFFLLGVLLIGYAILDGFDLGVGAWHLFSKGDAQRRVMMNSIGPVWDGNEVWLVTAGGALFAAFPHAYATAFSAFYLPFMLLLFALIFRAVALEFRSKEQMPWWRQMWDVAFSASSILAVVLFGVAVGNMIVGIPIGEDMEFTGNFFSLLNPYSLMVGIFNLSIFMMHGALYLHMKTDGDLQKKAGRWFWSAFIAFCILYMFVTIVTLVTMPVMAENLKRYPAIWIVVALNVLAVANIPRCFYRGKPLWAFISSACTIAALTFLFGMDMFPNMIVSSLDPAHSLTIYNAASSQKTLKIMLVIALCGMPMVVGYTIAIYRIFWGKVKLDKFSY